MKETKGQSCLILVGSVIILVIIYKVVEFFKDPEAIYKILWFFQGLGLCLGMAILFFIVVIFYNMISTREKQRFILESKEYPVSCLATLMKKIDHGDIPDDLSEVSVETPCPMINKMVITNYGIWCLGNPVGPEKGVIIAEDLSQDEIFPSSMENSIIQFENMKLYYTKCSHTGKFGFELKPQKSSGFTDSIPELTEGSTLKIVIVFRSIIKKYDLQNTIYLDQPIKLKLIVLDQNGNYDLAATTDLYKKLYERKKMFEPKDDDDSWMYRSRPIYW